MITEDCVSFETAKLLKEKGFDKDVLITDWWYDENGEPHKRGNYSYSGAPIYYKETCYNAPTLQMAMKWLREVHNLFIGIIWEPDFEEDVWYWKWNVSDRKVMYQIVACGQSNIYEEACETAIKYCLENLI